MKKHCFYVLLVTLFCLLANGCSFTKPYINQRIDRQVTARYSPGEKITIRDIGFIYEFSIAKTGLPQEYILQGTVDGSEGFARSIDHLVPSQSNFYLLLVQDGIIVDSFKFMPQGIDHQHKLPFTRKFSTSTSFGSVFVFGRVMVRG